MSRFSWQSPHISQPILDNIEKFLMTDKCCVILREKRKINNVMVYSDFYGVYKFTVGTLDPSQEIPISINIKNPYGSASLTQYAYNEFILIKDFALWSSFTTKKSISSIIHDYASKLALVDNVIECNLFKHKLPLHVKGKVEKNNTVKAYFKELYRNALYMFDGGDINNNFTVESPMVEFIIDKLQQHKEALIQEFCAMIGINNSQNYSDVYQNIESVKMNSSFVYNVAQSHFINRKKMQNTQLANKISLKLVQNEDIYGKVDLVKPDIKENPNESF